MCLFTREGMIYGYVVLKKVVETHCLPFYRSDNWDCFSKVTKVRLFKKEADRDNAMKVEKTSKGHDERDEILAFTTKSIQGGLNMKELEVE